MSSLVSPVPSARKQLSPVSVVGYFVGGATRQDLLYGAAILSITDQGSTEEQAYWCESLFYGEKVVGFRLRKFASAEVYDVTLALDSCSCPDATYRPERPNGCRHAAALRQALPSVTNE